MGFDTPVGGANFGGGVNGGAGANGNGQGGTGR